MRYKLNKLKKNLSRLYLYLYMHYEYYIIIYNIYMYIYCMYVCVTIIEEKEVMNLRESKERVHERHERKEMEEKGEIILHFNFKKYKNNIFKR